MKEPNPFRLEYTSQVYPVVLSISRYAVPAGPATSVQLINWQPGNLEKHLTIFITLSVFVAATKFCRLGQFFVPNWSEKEEVRYQFEAHALMREVPDILSDPETGCTAYELTDRGKQYITNDEFGDIVPKTK